MLPAARDGRESPRHVWHMCAHTAQGGCQVALAGAPASVSVERSPLSVGRWMRVPPHSH